MQYISNLDERFLAPLGRQSIPRTGAYAILGNATPGVVHVADHVLRELIAERREFVAVIISKNGNAVLIT